ncbi:lipid A deacylase LpxR family protein [Vibrio furnissii]|uniref:lipid A deacylase LpxR family protein n=1 Tax=Vibrio TaxID=662 RepID=UPI0025744B57|nr:lipid A deacylase LpxR family protein [Vibrio furnissii]WJG27143.1 lipid A deacylase LpxR family protein [Vibrio furnissii]
MKLLRLLPLTLLCGPALAATQATLSMHLDNDGIFGVDEDYTNGIFFTYTSQGIRPPWWVKPLSVSAWGASSLDKWEISVGHKMWTPADITLEKPQANERPYAGYLHAEFNYLSLHPQQAQRFNLTIGTTGDSSLSERAQTLVHSITNSDDPNGWDYQVEDKVAGSVGYLGHFNWMRSRTWHGLEWDVSNVSEVNVGNFRSDIATGIMLRWGQDLAGNFGSAQISAEKPFLPGMIGASSQGWFVYTGIEARYRFNDLTIEGHRPLNDLDHEPSYYEVTVEPVQATAVFGAAWYGSRMGASLAVAANSAEYKESRDALHSTGSFTLYGFF